MIDEKATYREFGYCSCDLAPKSRKKVICVCDSCGGRRIKSKRDYAALCKSCALKTYYQAHSITSNAHRIHLDYNLLKKLYVNERRTIQEIAEAFNCSRKTIARNLWKYGIKERGKGQISRHVEICDELKSIIIGELLGDGCITCRNNKTARYQHGSYYKKYIQWLFDLLASYGLKWGGKIQENFSKKSKNPTYSASTYFYSELLPIRENFYPNGKKEVPSDLELNPIILLHWYLGDGSLGYKKDKYGVYPYIRLSTNAFSFEGVSTLIKLLEKQKINAYPIEARYSQYEIYISDRSSIRRFFGFIATCPPEIQDIYGYKFPNYAITLNHFFQP